MKNLSKTVKNKIKMLVPDYPGSNGTFKTVVCNSVNADK